MAPNVSKWNLCCENRIEDFASVSHLAKCCLFMFAFFCLFYLFAKVDTYCKYSKRWIFPFFSFPLLSFPFTCHIFMWSSLWVFSKMFVLFVTKNALFVYHSLHMYATKNCLPFLHVTSIILYMVLFLMWINQTRDSELAFTHVGVLKWSNAKCSNFMFFTNILQLVGIVAFFFRKYH